MSTNDVKLFPRNLTAGAATLVIGNPVTSRPESAVDNAHPGLEMDPRQLERVFFKGLRFDFQYRYSARLSKVLDDGLLDGLGLSAVEMQTIMNNPLQEPSRYFIWYIHGVRGDQPTVPQLYDALADEAFADGYDVMRTVRDLDRAFSPGDVPHRLTIVVGTLPVNGQDRPAWETARKQALDAIAHGQAGVGRAQDGSLQWLMLVGERTDYLTADGVIGFFDEGQSLEPGVLTQSLCSPWQWDFADCGCYYWAASRPDIVTTESSASTSTSTLSAKNYQRQTRNAKPDDHLTYQKWMSKTITLPQMIEHWEDLPLVVDDRENATGLVHLTPSPRPAIQPLLNYQQIVVQLKYLATVEHALTVEYLYAYYSVVPADTANLGFSPQEARQLKSVAKDILNVALDEMQHLKWVNQALILLGEAPSLGRATEYGTPPLGVTAMHDPVPFELKPLTTSKLKTFIQIEQPEPKAGSPEFATSLYMHVIDSLARLDPITTPASFPPGALKKQRLIEVLKHLIDEAGNHVQRLTQIMTTLQSLWPEGPAQDGQIWLRVKNGPIRATDPELSRLQDEGNLLYSNLLQQLQVVFGGTQLGGDLSSAAPARRAMSSMRDVAQKLAAHGYGLLFELPATVTTP